ncbi:hypothetical protein ALC57_06874 [Trachymyrmex cornetzi]|uniref:Uncharacterized protein n=1 Tax=Trachymyrmex cornetzi TaxID=471704 RepID=A0A195E793_9HYME|nr:hypothetical protein ALC57_06874 [Trachymyrmex cornetzi]
MATAPIVKSKNERVDANAGFIVISTGPGASVYAYKRTLSLPPPSHSLSFHPCSPPPPTHIFRNIYVRREEEELDGEEREKDGDRESTGYILPPRRLRSGWRGPLGWLPHERCIRRLTGGAIKSRQQTNRQSPLCTP